MNIQLFEEDLIERFLPYPTEDITFRHLKPVAKRVVVLAGSARFFRRKGTLEETSKEITPERNSKKIGKKTISA